jgi:tRNA G26 N,N-dimethylase Trm1
MSQTTDARVDAVAKAIEDRIDDTPAYYTSKHLAEDLTLSPKIVGRHVVAAAAQAGYDAEKWAGKSNAATWQFTEGKR